MALSSALGATPETVHSNRYHLHLGRDASLELRVAGKAVRFLPHFTILYRADDPGLNGKGRAREANFPVPAWKSVADGSPTEDLFQAARPFELSATEAKWSAGRVIWTFPDAQQFRLEAELILPEGGGDPQLSFRFTPASDGWYSVGYTGAPAEEAGRIESLWQPLVWQERRFPMRCYLSMEYMSPLPTTLVNHQSATIGVVVDPAEIPFRLPTFANSRFGVLVRNALGQAQPMVFAPVLGSPESRMSAGKTFSFRLRLIAQPGDWFEAFRHIARDIYGFLDYRENVGASLNDTLENMIDFVMDDHYSEWSREFKGFGYSDVGGTVKIVSSLHPLSVALLTDNQEIYVRRALPMIEYALSREKFLLSLRPDIKGQSASHFMRGPAVEVSELGALFSMSGNRSPVFRHYAEAMNKKSRVLNLDMVSEAWSWQNTLALYRATGDRRFLEQARQGADKYIAERIDRLQTDFSDVRIERGGQFWTDFAPKWIDLVELYEETRDSRYLRAASAGARIYASYAWLSPMVPGGNILIHKGNVLNRPRLKRVPEQLVPAWRVAHLGLISEASTTFAGNYAVFLSHFAPYMLRLASYTGDDFLRDIARSAVVGRYSNYAGYNIAAGDWTTLYGRADFPLRSFRPFFPEDWTNAAGGLGSYYSNQIFPNIALVVDYLISDAFTRSKGKINFPSEYAQGYAYLQSKVYGSRPGTFYETDGVRLWMPRNLLRLESIQANYIAAYGDNEFYLALLNQSSRPLKIKVNLNPDVVPIDADRSYQVRTWYENVPGAPLALTDGEVLVSIAAKGITALAVEGLRVMTRFQEKVFDRNAQPLSDQSFSTIETPFGKVTGMLISMGKNVDSGFVWLDAAEAELKEARLHYKEAGTWKELIDKQYPFEFSMPFSSAERSFEYWVEAIKVGNELVRSAAVELRR